VIIIVLVPLWAACIIGSACFVQAANRPMRQGIALAFVLAVRSGSSSARVSSCSGRGHQKTGVTIND
jgi:hypothetical protein